MKGRSDKANNVSANFRQPSPVFDDKISVGNRGSTAMELVEQSADSSDASLSVTHDAQNPPKASFEKFKY